MKKIISIVSILILGIGSIMAQTDYRSVKGYVVDKNGNPIPGAEVTTPGGGESAITDSDGSFNINVHRLLKKLTATYDGMTTQTLKISPDKELVFTLRGERKKTAFVNAVVGFSYNKNGRYTYGDEHTMSSRSPSFGIMSGMLGKWGFYGKAACDCFANLSITAGVVKSIYHRMAFLYAGVGYGMSYIYYTPEDDYPYHENHDFRPGLAADLGFIFKTGSHFNLTIGYNLITTFPFTEPYGTYINTNYVHGLQVGLGYVF